MKLKMKSICYMGLAAAMSVVSNMSYAASDKQFRAEVLTGLDIIGARRNADVIPDMAPGALGADVYQVVGAVDTTETKLFIPTSMYVRMGGGLNLAFATDKARLADKEYETENSYTTQIGLGWNLSSYVRTEIDLQSMNLKFKDLEDATATYKTAGTMLYFDFARRYVQTGDITRRRTFVPFMGIGAGLGVYDFEGASGADGFIIAAPRAAVGFNIMLNDLIGIDIMYQYQMMIGNGFGWDVRRGGVDNISNIMASVRANF